MLVLIGFTTLAVISFAILATIWEH